MNRTTALKVPRKPSLGGHRISAAAVTEALEHLGINAPVQIKWSQGRRRLGAHRFRPGVGHVITVTTYHRYASGVSETIWHELTHAHQLERAVDPKSFITSYREESRRVGYRNNRFEVEAREVGARMSVLKPLVAGQMQATSVPVPVTPRPVVQPVPRPASAPAMVPGPIGTGHVVAVQRKNRKGHVVQVIDGKLHSGYGTQGGRWVVINTTNGSTQRFAGKRDAKAAIASA